MINWNRYSFDQINEKWDTFIRMRKKYPSGTPKKEKSHITCIERETLIDNLLHRIEKGQYG